MQQKLGTLSHPLVLAFHRWKCTQIFLSVPILTTFIRSFVQFISCTPTWPPERRSATGNPEADWASTLDGLPVMQEMLI